MSVDLEQLAADDDPAVQAFWRVHTKLRDRIREASREGASLAAIARRTGLTALKVHNALVGSARDRAPHLAQPGRP